MYKVVYTEGVYIPDGHSPVYMFMQGQIEYTGMGLRIDAFCGWRHLVILAPYHRAAISDPPSYAIFIPRPLF